MNRQTAPTSAPRRIRLIAVSAFLISAFAIASYYVISPPAARGLSSGIVISQLYGGGGNAGSTYKNDFIELFNRGSSPVSVTGWSVQYASAAGTTWAVTNITGTIPAGGYYLVQEAVGAGGTTNLPAPDATGSIAMSATAGKVALVNNTSALSGACPSGANIIDFVGFGTTANCFEGTGPTPAPSNTTAALRGNNGCTENDQNGTDFSVGAPTPRNSSAPTNPCTGPPALSINDVSVTEGNSGPTTAMFTVSLSAPAPAGGVTFDIATADGPLGTGATVADNDYVANILTGQTISAGNQTYSFNVTVNGDTNFESNETFFVNVTNISANAAAGDTQGQGTIANDDCPSPAGDVVISQVYGGGGNTGATFTHDFIELFNQGGTTVNLSGWTVQYSSSTGTGVWATTPLSGSIAPGGYYLVQEAQGAGGTTPLPTPDAIGTIALAAGAGKVALSSTTIPFVGACPTCAVDLVGYDGANCFEGTGPTGTPSNTTAVLRKRRGCTDTNNNNADFTVGSPDPRNTAAPTNNCVLLVLPIHTIQGNGAASPYVNQDVTTSGIVTARKSNGFFLQEPDASIDLDPATSEGIFVFTSVPPVVAVGDAVTINVGSVVEFFNLTEINTSSSDLAVTSSGNALPVPVVVTISILNAAGTVDQMERFEGMRLHADSLTTIGPSNEFGEAFTVLTGVSRPFREPGIEASFALPTGTPCCVPRFDENPERLMIDTDGQVGATSIALTTGVTLTNVTGPLDFTFDDYKLLPDTPPGTTSNLSAIPVRAPNPDEFTVGSFNMERFLTAADVVARLNKVSLAIRNVMRSPDVIGVEEVGDITLLQTIATALNADTVGGGGGNPGYVAYLEEGNDIGGIDVGFLVKSSRVNVVSVEQVGKNEPFQTGLLNDRPPLVLRATIQTPGDSFFPFTVIVNHLRSLIDVSDTGPTGDRVRAKRRAQAEFLANYIQSIQTTENVVSVGDYNAFQVNDGYVDVMGTIRGVPTPMDQVVLASPDLVTPDLTDLIGILTADQQYSFVFVGNAQVIDHVLVDPEMLARNTGFAYARNNADFPEAYRGDVLRSERVSDHDMPVAYFNFPPPSADLSITKTDSPDPVVTGSGITYTITVTNNGIDNASNVVVTDNLPVQTTFVSCNSTGGGVCGGSGNNRSITFTTLPIGGSAVITIQATVNCSVSEGTVINNTATVSSSTGDPDLSNNSSSALTTASNPAPVLTCPSNIVKSNDPGQCGAVVTYPNATASDNCAVGSPSCSPPSGSFFAVGTTTVNCTVTDSGGRSGSCSFTVTVTDSQAPVITGATANPSSLWPPNHKMVNVTINYGVTDNCTPTSAINCDLTVASNEPPSPPGDGHTSADWTVVDAHHVQLRADREASGSDRIYTITITCKDSSNNTTTKTVTVTVPHNQ
jgi:uncharacterized protein